MTCRWFPCRFGSKAGILLKSEVGSFRKLHLIFMRRQNSSESFLNSSSFIFLWIGAMSKPFSRIFISASDRTLWLKLKIVSEQKCPFKRLLLVFSVMLFPETSVLFCNSSRIFTRSSSCDERKFRSNVLSEIFDVFIDKELLVTLTGGDVCILEEFSFSSWSKIFFIFVKSNCWMLIKDIQEWGLLRSKLDVCG